MEEYMYQKLGYKEIAKKFLDINVEQMKWREEKNSQIFGLKNQRRK